MKKLYMEYFKISDDSKITDKAMLGRVISTVAVILVCVVTMSFTAFAFFTSDATSSVAPIQTAVFDVDIAVNNGDVDVVVSDTDSNLYSIYNKTADNKNYLSAGEYTFVITRTAESSASTGYCVITVGDDILHTYQLSALESRIEFTLKLAHDTSVPVTVNAQWGTSIYYANYADNGIAAPNYILNGREWPLAIPPAVKPNESDTTEQTVENNNAETDSEVSTDTSGESTDEVITENQDENNQQLEE
ncbi:MAG: hypothetical protein J6B80_04905 [Clostridia bacterium]|nr:hypothetical protein [Clostridia bacterium]